MLELFSDILDDSWVDDSSSINELDCYLREPVLDYKMSKPFAWWAEHHSRYPVIAQIPKHYLTATATSVLSEKLQLETSTMKGEAGYHPNMQKACYSSKATILCLVKSNHMLTIC